MLVRPEAKFWTHFTGFQIFTSEIQNFLQNEVFSSIFSRFLAVFFIFLPCSSFSLTPLSFSPFSSDSPTPSSFFIEISPKQVRYIIDLMFFVLLIQVSFIQGGLYLIFSGTGNIIHPRAQVIAESGPIEFGENNLIEENAVIINRYIRFFKS